MCAVRCEITASVATGSRNIGNMSANGWPCSSVSLSGFLKQEVGGAYWDGMVAIELYLAEDEFNVRHILDLGSMS